MRMDFIPRFDSWDPQLLQSLLDTANLKFLWGMQESSGTSAKDYGPNNVPGTYNGTSLNRQGINRRVNRAVSFDGAVSYVQGVGGNSVMGMGSITLLTVANVNWSASIQTLWYESVDTNNSITRLTLNKDTNNLLVIGGRTNPPQAFQSVSSASAIAKGTHMFHATIDVPSNTLKIYMDGVQLATTGAPNFGGDTIFNNVVPLWNPTAGRTSIGSYFNGNLSYMSMYSRVLSAAEILAHAKAGGFA